MSTNNAKWIDRRTWAFLERLARAVLERMTRAALDKHHVSLWKARRAAAQVALDISYPMNPDGTRSLQLTRLGDRLDIDATTPASREHRAEAIRVANLAGNAVPPKDEPLWYAHCSRWVGPIINTTLDPRFPADWTKWQLAYVQDPSNGWVRMGAGLLPDDQMLPGDVILTDEWHPSGHVVMWVGTHGGYTDVVTEASWGGLADGILHPDSKLGGLRRARGPRPWLDDSGRDKRGRAYSTWRYYGTRKMANQ